ncbi:MAG: peptide chain release factor N(5)-glutamine methyltransferase [Nitrospiraceae bacterium]|nr:peptide chain release factor N(5)-glutamine methyltransferase [Nitrospiraceae bacterium]
MSAAGESRPPRFPTHAERIAAITAFFEPVSETPRLDAEILLAEALGISRSLLLASLQERAETPALEAMVERRRNHEPIAYILGEWEFFSLTFYVVPPLLVPRPETEHLVEAVLDFVPGRPAHVLDVGTGTGCIAVSIAHQSPALRVTATDINPLAIETASRNAKRHGVADHVELVLTDLVDGLARPDGGFDVICSNPPYVEEGIWSDLPPVIRFHEDPRALLAGPDGMDLIRRIASDAVPLLCCGGLLMLEIGDGQRVAVEEVLRASGYEKISFERDLAGIERIASARKPGK